MSATPQAGTPPLASLRQQAGNWWRSRTPRERQAVSAIGLVLGSFAIWSVLVQPALRSVREAPAQLDRLEAQYQQMQRVATQSGTLRGATRVSPVQAGQALRAATERLGSGGRLTLQGDRATLTLTEVSPEALRAWLNEARNGARARPTEAQLQRSASGYSGTLALTLGGAS